MHRLLSFIVGSIVGFLLVGLWPIPSPAVPLSGGDLLVADWGTGTVRQYSATGVDLGIFASGFSTAESPAWISAGSTGTIWVSDYRGRRIVELSPAGVELRSLATPYEPGRVAVAPDGTIYVADYFGGRVFRYSASGADLGLFASTGLQRADFMTLDEAGNLYVTDFFSGAIRRFSSTGADLGTFATLPGVVGLAFDAGGDLYAASYTGHLVRRFSEAGVDLGTFASTNLSQPYGLAFDTDGNLYVANFAAGNIRAFSSSGDSLGIFASTGLHAPRDLLVYREAAPVPEPSTFVLFSVALAVSTGGVWLKRHG